MLVLVLVPVLVLVLRRWKRDLQLLLRRRAPTGVMVVVDTMMVVLLNRMVAGPARGIHPRLVIAELLDLLLVGLAFLLFHCTIRRLLFWASISPHLAEQPRNVCVTHVRVIGLHLGTTCLRVLEEGRHGALGGVRVLLGAALRNVPDALVRRLFSDEPEPDPRSVEKSWRRRRKGSGFDDHGRLT